MGERTHIGQHLVEPHSSGANGTGDPAILAQIYDPGDALCACWRMIFAPQDRMVDVDVGRKAVMNCVEEHDTCLTTAITSSQHLRGAAKPISTLQFGKTPGPSSKQASRSDVHYRPKRLSSALHGGRSRRPADATAAHDRQPTAASALPEALPIPGALLPRTRDASTIEQRRVFVSVAALYSMRCLTACGRVILGCSGGRSDDRAMSDGCRGRSGYVRNVRRNYVAERRDY